MRLTELTAYAEQKYQIREEFKWADFPGFSVLVNPKTGKWAALLMRKWDPVIEEMTELCDLKCGRKTLLEEPFSYLSSPFRMHGQKWIGVRFTGTTDPKVILRLFDKALQADDEGGFTIVLEEPVRKEGSLQGASSGTDGAFVPTAAGAPSQGIVSGGTVYRETELPAYWPGYVRAQDTVPEKIRKMKKLYEYGSGSFHQKCRNFYLQGMFMQDYEDNCPWNGDFFHYFPTYHDLNVKQLRGYFTWRTRIRRGEYTKTSSSFAFMYLYELLNGIGVSSPEESLQKMREFETGYVEAGYGDPAMKANLRRWMLDLSVLKNIPPEHVSAFADSEALKRDRSLSVLRQPSKYQDEEVYDALCVFGGNHLSSSPTGEKGRKLFAAVWKRALELYREGQKDFFTVCFGKPGEYPWHPLANAVYWERNAFENREYVMNDCRRYRSRDGVWTEIRYEKLFFDLQKIRGLMHAADLKIRRYLKTGHYLREKADEAWAVPYVEAVLEEDRQEEIEAARPKININLSGLEQIRKDADLTRESLLTEEDRKDAEEVPVPYIQVPEQRMAVEEAEPAGISNLDRLHTQILISLIRGEDVRKLLRENMLMPSLAADTINDAFYEELGDIVVECEEDRLVLVEDYIMDLESLIGYNGE